MAATSNAETLRHVANHVSMLLNNSPLYSHLFPRIRLISAASGHVIAHLDLEPMHLNSKGSLHGSISAAIVDFIGGVAISSYDCRDSTGVSTDMHITFVGGAKAGDTLEIEGSVARCGGTLAYTNATIRKFDRAKGALNGDLVTTGSHTKFVKQRS